MIYIKNKVLLIIFLSLMIFSAKIFAEIEVNVSMDKKDFTIGDNVNIEFKFMLPKNYELIRPEYDCIPNWYVKNIAVSRDKMNHSIYIVNILATTFNPMQKELPVVNFVYLDDQKKEHFISTNSVSVKVTDVLKDNIDEKHLKDIKPVKTLNIESLYYYIILLFGLYLIFSIIIYLKKHTNMSVNDKDKIKYKILFQIESIMLNDDNLDINSRYEAMLNIIKNFIRIEYNINTSKLTIDSIIMQISKIELSASIIKCLSNLLIKCSSIKSSDLKLTEENIKTDLANINTIVKNSVQNKKILSSTI
ncbi:MAG: hypothetical protein PHG84_03490 [Endomicrobiaceae bacterium]|nr:hypothetical protein [Endomicrobiaceae bacterium]